MTTTVVLLALTVLAPSPEAVRHHDAGLTAKRDGRLADAETELRAALALDPTYPDAHWVLAWVLAGADRTEDAITAFEAFLALPPEPERQRQAEAALQRLRAVKEALANPQLDPDSVCHAKVVVPLVFPVVGRVYWEDTFLAPRGGGTRRHLGQDLMADKLTPLVAAFDGTVWFGSREPGGSHSISVTGDNGWRGFYVHVNNDHPGTDDGLGGGEYAYAPWLERGDRVVAGQLIGWVGDSGNAEETAPHLHFELWRQGGGVYNAGPSLKAARKIAAPVAVDVTPELVPEAGEVRLAGVVQAVDLSRRVVILRLQSRLAEGKLTCPTQPQRVYVVWGEAPQPTITGSAEAVALEALLPGTRMVVMGQPGANSLAARCGFVVGSGTDQR